MLRYFAYIDESTIDSFNNQLNNSFIFKKFNKTKENIVDGEVKISIMNIIRGFISGDGSIRVSSKNLKSEEIEIANSIELKIMRLIDLAYGNEEESINEILAYNRKLICGKFRLLKCKSFLELYRSFMMKNLRTLISFILRFKLGKIYQKDGKRSEIQK